MSENVIEAAIQNQPEPAVRFSSDPTMNIIRREKTHMKYAEIKTEYLENLKLEGAAKTTLVTYQSNGNHFGTWLAENGHSDPDVEFAFAYDTLKSYMKSLNLRKQRPRTVRGKFDPIRGMVNYLIDWGRLETNPFEKLKMPKKDAAERLTMTQAEAEKLWEACERHPDPRQVAFWRALVATLLFTGARAEEITNIEVGHINLEDESLLIASGKGSKARTLYLTPDTVVAYKTWLAERAKLDCKHAKLFARGPRQGMSPEKLRAHLEEIKAIAGFRDAANIKPHSCRHFFATNMHKNGAVLKEIQVALGHAELQTTAIYLHADEDSAKVMKTYAVFKPRDGVGATSQRPAMTKPGRSTFMQRRRSPAARSVPVRG